MGALRSLHRGILGGQGLDRSGARRGAINPLGTLKATRGRYDRRFDALTEGVKKRSVVRRIFESIGFLRPKRART